MITLAFDIYGTLINTHGLLAALQTLIGDQATAFSVQWREKQLEYSFRRGLMRQYASFSICTRDALNHTDALLQTNLTPKQKQELLNRYKTLPAFDNVRPALSQLSGDRFACYAFSNGNTDAVQTLLTNAGIAHHFKDIISAEEISTFKPNPDLYTHFLTRTGAKAATTWLISGNPFDIIGAASQNWKTAWLRRTPTTPYDPWNIPPTITIPTLTTLPQQITNFI